MHSVLIDFNFFAYSIQLANALAELCQVTLMLPDKASARQVEAVKESVNLRQFHMPRLRHASNISMVYDLFRTIANLGPHVVHQFAWHPWMNLALPVFPRVPLVATIHDATRHPGDRASYKMLQSWQWNRSEQVIVHADNIKHQLVDMHQVPEHKIHVVPLGTCDIYRLWASDQVCEQSGTILFFGRIWEYKGLQYLIQAEPLISEQVPNVRIVIAGQGEPFEKYAQLMVHEDRFDVHNHYIPDEMVARFFQEASLVVLPYSEASQSGILSIAYAFGKPVVATTVGGIPEVVQHGETGYLVPPRDSQALAEAVIRLLQDQDLRRKMGRKALQKAASELSWTSIARQTLDVYETAVTTFRRK